MTSIREISSDTVTRNIPEFACRHCNSQLAYVVELAGGRYIEPPSEWSFVDEKVVGTAFAIVKCKSCQLQSVFVFSVRHKRNEVVEGSREDVNRYALTRPGLFSAGWNIDYPVVDETWVSLTSQLP
jgi:hypothetical protein